jgi:hypothetical protein
MTTAALPKTDVLSRLLDEGFGPGAWHGPDMRAAIAGVDASTAFARPPKLNHSIAEIVLHHAWTVRNVTKQITGGEPPAFPVEGDDWLKLAEDKPLSWRAIQEALETQQRALAAAMTQPGSSNEAERFNLALGVTCHAVYHAGQIQLVKVLRGA